MCCEYATENVWTLKLGDQSSAGEQLPMIHRQQLTALLPTIRRHRSKFARNKSVRTTKGGGPCCLCHYLPLLLPAKGEKNIRGPPRIFIDLGGVNSALSVIPLSEKIGEDLRQTQYNCSHVINPRLRKEQKGIAH